MDHQPQRLPALARCHGIVTGLSAVLTVIFALAGTWLCAPLALVCLTSGYLWGMQLTYEPDSGSVACRRCRAGCVGCRERIDAPARRRPRP